MYSLYSVLVLILAVVASPWFLYQAARYKKYVGSLGQRMGYLPVSFNMDGDESIWAPASPFVPAARARSASCAPGATTSPKIPPKHTSVWALQKAPTKSASAGRIRAKPY